jgi:transposase InsO family protein
MHDRCADPFLIPSQLLVVDVLQRPLEFTQYTALAFAKKLEDFDITASMESRGDAYDNAAAESFMAIIKTELTKRCRFANHMQARTAIFDYIEGFYNRRRRHSALGYKSPLNFERIYATISSDKAQAA